jgi:hypothetical protein
MGALDDSAERAPEGTPEGAPAPDAEPWRAWMAADAERLAARLRAGGVPRARRARARALLAEAFTALEGGQPGRRLACALDAAATPPPPRPLAQRRAFGVIRRLGAVDWARVRRIIGYWEWAEGRVARHADFLEAAGFDALPRSAREVRPGRGLESNRVLTDG